MDDAILKITGDLIRPDMLWQLLVFGIAIAIGIILKNQAAQFAAWLQLALGSEISAGSSMVEHNGKQMEVVEITRRRVVLQDENLRVIIPTSLFAAGPIVIVHPKKKA